jgi:hypothetical protein
MVMVMVMVRWAASNDGADCEAEGFYIHLPIAFVEK